MATRSGPGRLFSISVSAAVAVMLSCASRAEAAWRRLDTPNFTVIGRVGEGKLRSVATEFERFREALAQLLDPRATSTAVPTVVIVFESARAFESFQPVYRGKRVNVAGMFVPSEDVNYIALAGDRPDFQTVFHEYAHLVMANIAPRMPTWLGEGLAEYYSTFALMDGGRKALVGRPIDSHLLILRDAVLLNPVELLSVERDSPLYNEGVRRNVFYAQSWALVHYLLHGSPPRSDLIAKYADAVEAGTTAAEAWNRIFGPGSIETGLVTYIRRSQLKMVSVTLTERVVAAAAPPTPLSDTSAEAFLGDFLSRQERWDEATARLEPVAARPDGVRARTALARVRNQQNRASDARALLARTSTAGSGDWLADYAYGMAAAEVFASETPEGGAAATAAAREALQRALAVRPNLAHAWHVLGGLARLADGDLETALAASEQAQKLAPKRVEYVLGYAETLLRRREYAKARDVLGPLLVDPRAAALRDQIRSVLAHSATLELAATQAPGVEAPGSDPGRVVALNLRKPQPGEERAAGMLMKIDCTREGTILHVRIGGQPIQFRTGQFQRVEFITYRDDLRGDIACGPRNPEDLVYVTWQAASAASPRILVALEFLPKGYRLKASGR